MSELRAGVRGPFAALAISLALADCGGGGSDTPPATYTVGGSVAGLSAPGLVLTNGTDMVSPAANSTSFVFATALTSGTSYAITIKTQPNGQTCTVSSGSGTVSGANVSTVTVSCPSPWVWQGGTQTTNAAPVYGTRGVAAATNTPGSRSGAAFWTDSSGNVWLFGGGTVNGVLADLWSLAPATGLWTWVGGFTDANAPGVYGTQGVAASTNGPGARGSAITWTDTAGDLWLFGGGGDGAQTGSGFFNDLWRFSTATGQWTWVSGSSMATLYGGGNLSGSYGTQGVAAAGNLPPARADGVAWRDSMGNLWLFSGAGNAMQAAAQSATGLNNDLWMYSPQTNLWTWVAGSNSTVPDGSFTAVYGTKGTAAAGNVPPAREGAATWNDAQGNLWLFGGQYAVVGTGTPFLNDLWEFSPSTKLWTWVGGSQITSSLTSTYGDEGTPAAANAPGIRSNSGAWTDATGRFWLFGGTTPGSNLDICCSVSNDLWSYDPITGLWTWVSGAMENGASATGSFGTLGAAGVGNAPPGRSSPVTFLDSSGNLWLYGGPDWSSNGLADLWEFNITPTTP